MEKLHELSDEMMAVAPTFAKRVAKLELELSKCKLRNTELSELMMARKKRYLKQMQELLLLRRISQVLIDRME